MISIHAPRAGRDPGRRERRDQRMDFNPRAPCGARPSTCFNTRPFRIFQSTRPVRGATWRRSRRSHRAPDFNPRAPCGARRGFVATGYHLRVISIHAPRAGRDVHHGPAGLVGSISIHAPRAGRDSALSSLLALSPDFNPRAPCGARRLPWTPGSSRLRFQSTRPVRGATGPSLCAGACGVHFNPRAPCGARPPPTAPP